MNGWAKRRRPRLGMVTLALAGLIGLGAAACDDDPSDPADATDPEIEALRNATDGFHDLAAAQAAGYTVLVTHPETGAACLADPAQGAMGRHFLREDLVDDAVSVTAPEAMIYEPLPSGELSLVGVEYLIPYTILASDETPPTLFGRDFLHNPTFGVWMLHAWAWKTNPTGMFATWNPDVTCDHDAAVVD